MDDTALVSAKQLEDYANTIESETVVPGLVYQLIIASVADLTRCEIPYGEAVRQPGFDGVVETPIGFREFVPSGLSYWEIGCGASPVQKATEDFAKRTPELSDAERAQATFVFVTPRKWPQSSRRKWIEKQGGGWAGLKIIESVQLANWLRGFPAIAKGLLMKVGGLRTLSGVRTPLEHWQSLSGVRGSRGPTLPPDLFLSDRDEAVASVEKVLRGESRTLVLAASGAADVEDFVAALLVSRKPGEEYVLGDRCLFVDDAVAWDQMAALQTPHVFVVNSRIDWNTTAEQPYRTAIRNGHAVITTTGVKTRSPDSVLLRNPSELSVQNLLSKAGYPAERAREFATIGAESIAALKRSLLGLPAKPPYVDWDSAPQLAKAMLIGQWEGRKETDRDAVAAITGLEYEAWTREIGPEALRSDSPLSRDNECWNVLVRKETWMCLGPHLGDADVTRFAATAIAVLAEKDPQFELCKEERYAAGVRGKGRQHSARLREGLTETLALLGSHSSSLTSCSHDMGRVTADRVVRNLLSSDDWVTWASLDRLLPPLAEAAPGVFLTAVERALANLDSTIFKDVFAQESAGTLGRIHTTGLLWALETMAWDPDHLARASICLAELAAIDPGGNYSNRPINSLRDIFLPWHPQTAASIPARAAAVRTVFQEQPQIGWRLLLSLLPKFHSSTSGCATPKWRTHTSAGATSGVSNQDYWKQVDSYTDLALSHCLGNIEHLADLVSRLADLSDIAQSRLLDQLASETITGMAEIERLPLWERLIDLVTHHGNYLDAEWAMESAVLDRARAVAEQIKPASPSLRHRRLFRDSDRYLADSEADYAEQLRRIDEYRQSAVQEIVHDQGPDGLLAFARSVAAPWRAGDAMGKVQFDDFDRLLFPASLLTTDEALSGVLNGYVRSAFQAKGGAWVESMVSGEFSVDDRVSFFIRLPFTPEVWDRAEQALGTNVDKYWQMARVQPWWTKERLEDAAQKLVTQKRPRAALSCLYQVVMLKKPIKSTVLFQALMDSVRSTEDWAVPDAHELSELIATLQDDPQVTDREILAVEWAYMPVLEQEGSQGPVRLNSLLASEPEVFHDIIRTVFRSRKTESDQTEMVTEDHKRIAENGYRVLKAWDVVPGTLQDGTFDPNAFRQWLDKTKALARESGHLEVAMLIVGEVLTHAPADTGGLWIHTAIAEAVNSKDAEDIRDGFTIELFNSRGVHFGSSGREERKLAHAARAKAESLDARSFHRFATAMRDFAQEYDRLADLAVARA